LLRDILQQSVESAVGALIASGKLPEEARIPIEIADTKNPEHGDYACNYALMATKKAGLPPRQIGEMLSEALLAPNAEHQTPFLSIDIAGPGFLNFKLNPDFVANYVGKILELGNDLACSDSYDKALPKLNVEFVSVNPNGPITVGSGRGAAFGDALVRVFRAAGYDVDPEYYINDGVNSQQMRLFAESVKSYALSEPFPENGYKGEYVKAVADDVANLFPSEDVSGQPVEWWQARSQELMIDRQREDLKIFGVGFDTWFSEQSMHDSGLVSSSLRNSRRTVPPTTSATER
jgi:arginyl-tRNA synthetase